MSNETVEPYFTREVTWVEPSSSIEDALHVIAAGRFSCLVVCEKERPVGIITERDVVQLAARMAAGEADVSGTAGDLMTSPVAIVTSNELVIRAVQHMLAEAIRHLVVVDADGLLAGLLSQTDLLRAQCGLPAAGEGERTGSAEKGALLPGGIIDDRRATQRYREIELPAVFWDGPHKGDGIIQNISVSGALLQSVSRTVEKEAEIKLEFSFLESAIPLEVSARVVRVTTEGFAVEFQSLSPRIKGLLRSAIRKAARAADRC